MKFKINTDCTALKADMQTSVLLKKNQTLDSKDFYLPSLIALATNGRKDSKGKVMYESSIDLDVSSLTKEEVEDESVNSFKSETADAKKDATKQPKKD